jgi:outer membrane protein OmpA-like peptidoglycan-associated protein/tetratricopeptide (TPR) repeat protein
MKTIYVTVIALFLIVFANANTKRADRLFEKWDYYKAAQLYEKAAKKNPSQLVYYKLGLCYQKMHKYSSAVTAYDKVNAMGHYDDKSFYLNYGLVLKANERYSDAETAFTTYASMDPSDTKGSFYKNSCDTVVNDINYNLPMRITGVSVLNSSMSDLCPVLYKDGVVFISSRQVPGHGSKIYGWDGEYYLNIMYAKKGNNDTTFSNVSSLQSSVLNCKYHNGPACFSKNYDTIYFNRVSKELKGQEKRTLTIERNKIYWSVYKNGAWSELKPFLYNNDTFSVATPCLANNGSRIYFSSDMPGGYGGDDIYYCDKQGDGWSKPINAGSTINTFGDEKFPSMDSAGNLYFSSNGYQGFGGMDICVAKNVNGNYAQAHVLKEPFNSSADDYGITFIKPGRIGYFSSNRRAGQGDENIYYFNLDKDSLPCPVAVQDYVIGFKCPQKQVVAITDTIRRDTTIFKFSPAPLNFNEETEMARIHFDFDKYQIRPDAEVTLDSVVSLMKKYPDTKILLNGYCDSRGTFDYNMVLSVERSEAALNYLAARGISKTRMSPKGYGKTHYLNRCMEGVICSDFEHEENRRVEILYENNKKNTATSLVNQKK